MDHATGEDNTKQKNGAVGVFSRNALNRKSISVDSVIVALIPFLNKEIYF